MSNEKKEVPNQNFLADVHAGKAEEKGNKINPNPDSDATSEEKKNEEASEEAESVPETVGGLRVEESDQELAPETVDEGAYAEDENPDKTQ